MFSSRIAKKISSGTNTKHTVESSKNDNSTEQSTKISPYFPRSFAYSKNDPKNIAQIIENKIKFIDKLSSMHHTDYEIILLHIDQICQMLTQLKDTDSENWKKLDEKLAENLFKNDTILKRVFLSEKALQMLDNTSCCLTRQKLAFAVITAYGEFSNSIPLATSLFKKYNNIFNKSQHTNIIVKLTTTSAKSWNNHYIAANLLLEYNNQISTEILINLIKDLVLQFNARYAIPSTIFQENDTRDTLVSKLLNITAITNIQQLEIIKYIFSNFFINTEFKLYLLKHLKQHNTTIEHDNFYKTSVRQLFNNEVFLLYPRLLFIHGDAIDDETILHKYNDTPNILVALAISDFVKEYRKSIIVKMFNILNPDNT